MPTPHISRPQFPPGYADHPHAWVSWEEVDRKLSDAINYWFCSVRPNGRPHAIPKWAVWVNGRIYADGSPDTRHARNLARNPFASVHLESGSQAVILEGRAQEVRPAPELGAALAQEYARKYAALGYAPAPDSWDSGGLIEITPYKVMAWNSFTEDPTRFVFDSDRSDEADELA